DIPATGLTIVFFCLARSPDVWLEIREEVKGHKSKDLTFDRLKSFRIAQYVIKGDELESACQYAPPVNGSIALRLHPLVVNTSRWCTALTILPNGGGLDGTYYIFGAS
ncbi:hypothetical protein CC78DRAFT_599832, partial [Lojkania enalia]